jgi:hypothetical protein
MLEEAAKMNGAAVRKAFEEGVTRMEETIAASRRIAIMELGRRGGGVGRLFMRYFWRIWFTNTGVAYLWNQNVRCSWFQALLHT